MIANDARYCGLLFQRAERNEANLVRLADLFERPANACVARQSFAAIR
jgi:hypothetical protein